MKWRSPRFLIPLAIICILLILSTGIWVYIVSQQQQNPSTSHWVHLPPNASGQPIPTTTANEYLFKDATGGFVVYHLPTTLPVSFTWATYQNQQDGYAIDYPSNWIRVETSTKGHASLSFYPPGTDLKGNVPGGPQGIGFRWTETYQPAILTDTTITGIKPVIINGITGQLYTQGSLGTAIVVTLPLKGEGFVLTADATSDILIYVFQHMLDSLKFT